MNVRYDLGEESYTYSLPKTRDLEKVNTVLTNPKGDVLNMGVIKNVSKYQGFLFCNPKTLEMYKILDEIVLSGVEVDEVVVEGFKTTRKFKGRVVGETRVPVSEDVPSENSFGEQGVLEYDENGVLKERIDEEQEIIPTDAYFVGPTGGFVYELDNYEGEMYLDFDCRKKDDFDEWGREYKVVLEDGIVFVEYTKKKDDKKEYALVVGIKATNFVYDVLEDWVEKNYEYSQERGALSKRHVFRALRVHVAESKRLFFGVGFSKQEVKDQLFLLEHHQNELEDFERGLHNDLLSDATFKLPLSQDSQVAYNLAIQSLYKFLNQDLLSVATQQGSFAGFPWFTQIWSRDELVGLRAFINLGEEKIVKERITHYLELIDMETGMLPRLLREGSWPSADACFILAKRIEDFIFHLGERERIDYVFNHKEIEYMYERLNMVFNRLIKTSWDSSEELLKVKPGDSWMDTLEMYYPLDIQVQFLSFVSVLGVLSSLLKREEDTQRFLDLEDLLRSKISSTYYKGEGFLASDLHNQTLGANVFLAYYYYPGLFLREEWAAIFERAVSEMKTSWGGFSSLSKKDPKFVAEYSGENDQSYHRGDSWYWMNNIIAIVLHDFDKQKYASEITGVLKSSTVDMLTLGTLGFGSEISSAKEQRPLGCMAQLWSSSTYVEMIDKVNEKQ